MVDFTEPVLSASTPYADGHRDIILAWVAGVANYNAASVLIPASALFGGGWGGHFILKRISMAHSGTIGVSIEPVILPRGLGTEYWYLPKALTTAAADPIVWDDLNISIHTNAGFLNAALQYIGTLNMVGYAATDDIPFMMMELEWWP